MGVHLDGSRGVGVSRLEVICLESGERRIDVVEFTVLARVIGFDKDEVLSIVEAATEPDHRI